MKSALIVRGGWERHDPVGIGDLFAGLLRGEGYTVALSDTLDGYLDAEQMATFDLIVPTWTMGSITAEQERGLLDTIAAGTGVAGWHGGMGDAFRGSPEYQFMVGGQWVAHPGNDGIDYEVVITQPDDPIMSGLRNFRVHSEQYYLHVDPGNDVLATTTYSGEIYPWIAGTVMPVAWKRQWGSGKVFYFSVGHNLADFDIPEARIIMLRGMLWATR